MADRSASYLDEEDLGDGDVNIGKLVINEIMTNNKGTICDENGKLYDYTDHVINRKIDIWGYLKWKDGKSTRVAW